ncbi:hypothetical protein [Sphingomonas sp. Root720]|nr:hypothetical protein [Sphingomonas sp. Root720]
MVDREEVERTIGIDRPGAIGIHRQGAEQVLMFTIILGATMDEMVRKLIV